MTELRFDNHAVIVTGGGGGIGRELALLLASKGAHVIVADNGCEVEGVGSSPDPANSVTEEIRASGGEATACYESVVDESGAAAIVEAALSAYGRLDAVVNLAGIFDPAPFEEISTEKFRSMMNVHFFGTLQVTKAAWPHLVASGHGRIVNATSESFVGMDLLTSYGAAKGAIFSLTRNLAIEGMPHGIAANSIAPRAGTRMGVKHALVMGAPAEVREQAPLLMPPAVVAPAAAFLSHPSCSLNGETLFVAPNDVSRIAVIKTKGYRADDVSTEDIAAHLDEIMDVTDATVTDVFHRIA
jgi:NAD(P)-dependent dehydrogenase (short-subunit alcohol dehydrogenase family)